MTESAVLSDLRKVQIGIKRTAPEVYRMFIDGIDAMRNKSHVLDDIDMEVSQLIDARVNTHLPPHLITEAVVVVLCWKQISTPFSLKCYRSATDLAYLGIFLILKSFAYLLYSVNRNRRPRRTVMYLKHQSRW